jgi:hypothetical protein
MQNTNTHTTKKLFSILGDDKHLMAIFAGIILCGLALVGLAIAAGVVYF